MKISENKTMFAKLVMAMITVVMLVVAFSFSTVSVTAMAAEVPETVTIEEVPAVELETELAAVQLGSFENMIFEADVLNDDAQFIMLADGGDGSGAKSSDQTFEDVIGFFVKWIRRIGMVIAFVGAIIFAFAIKNNDAEQKQAGLLTMIAGFVAAAICQAVDMFDMFS